MATQKAIFDALKDVFKKASDVDALSHALGITNLMPAVQNAAQGGVDPRAIAHQLADHVIIVTIDCEHYTLNSGEMTEIGVVILKRRDLTNLVAQNNYGDHGENLMHQARHHFFRLLEVSNSVLSSMQDNH
jgi:hypothetical protein